MNTMKKTIHNGTLSASSYKFQNVTGIIVGIYKNADVVCFEEMGDKLRVLINDEAIERLGVEIVHTDHEWEEQK